MTWRAHLDESFEHGALGVRLYLVDVRPDGTIIYMNGDGSATQVEEGVSRPGYTGIVLPRDAAALAAVADALGRHVPSVNEMRRLEQTLDVERARVDKILDRALER